VSDKNEEIELKLLLEAIYQKYQYDFRGYSPGAIKRRLTLAKERFDCRSLSMLQEKLLREPSALPEALDLLTVQVSEMFRDPSYFRALREKVVPHLKTYPSLKVWVAGCGAGEELYSLAILFREEGLEARTIFYGTDINISALKKAEAGVYEMERIPLFTRNHQRSGGRSSLSDYYTAAYGAAVFDKTLRSRAVFSDHSAHLLRPGVAGPRHRPLQGFFGAEMFSGPGREGELALLPPRRSLHRIRRRGAHLPEERGAMTT
jgi:chemotaxis protein methyltransferase CheR